MTPELGRPLEMYHGRVAENHEVPKHSPRAGWVPAWDPLLGYLPEGPYWARCFAPQLEVGLIVTITVPLRLSEAPSVRQGLLQGLSQGLRFKTVIPGDQG